MARCPFERLKQMKRDIFHIFPSFFRLGAENVEGWGKPALCKLGAPQRISMGMFSEQSIAL